MDQQQTERFIKSSRIWKSKTFCHESDFYKPIGRYSNLSDSDNTLVLDANQKLSSALEPFVQKLNQN